MLRMYDLFWYPILAGYVSITEAEKMYEDQLLELKLAIEQYEPRG